MRLVSLAMYVSPPPPVAEATAALWAYLAQRLRAAGIGVPDVLDDTVRYDEAWTHPALFFAQTCGYPYVKQLRGKVRLVATPAYGHAGCEGALKRSFVIVRKDAPIGQIADLRGSRAAINEPDSNSGVNLFRALIAPYAEGRPFFRSVITTGGHRMSIAAVALNEADVASIDCVTYGNILRFEPQRLDDVRVIAETPNGPGLPFITHIDTSPDEVSVLREALRDAMDDPALKSVRDLLSLKGVEFLEDADYESLADLERQAVALGYPAIA